MNVAAMLQPLHLARAFALGMLATLLPVVLSAQSDSTRRAIRDTATVQGSIYSRPFIATTSRVSLGGYAEGNTNYFVEDGLTDGFSMELRRFNIFLYAPIATRVRFFTELEFEHGTEEIALETAQLDLQLTPALTARMGIVLPPIGAFNQNHDSPRWEFVDRPLVSTRILPATLSDVGFGLVGRVRPGRRTTLTYDAYITNGLGDGIIDNAEGRTSLAAGKRDEQFAEDNNGSPAVSARLGLQHRVLGELGVSYYGAIYNRYRVDGIQVDDARRVTMAAVDFSTAIGRVTIRGELAQVGVQLPSSLNEVFGARQRGGHVDVVLPLLQRRMLGQPNATLNLAFRAEYIDHNVGRFSSTGAPIRDDVLAWVPGLSLRPNASTVIKLNYRRHRTRDILGNPAARMGGYQVGFATYF
ncbi:MAG: hypothetical protein KA154_09745 [Gemmatimonadaceae bacterium]|nr:hypothetical protein [Gemmatimonadaceae bacterium]